MKESYSHVVLCKNPVRVFTWKFSEWSFRLQFSSASCRLLNHLHLCFHGRRFTKHLALCFSFSLLHWAEGFHMRNVHMWWIFVCFGDSARWLKNTEQVHYLLYSILILNHGRYSETQKRFFCKGKTWSVKGCSKRSVFLWTRPQWELKNQISQPRQVRVCAVACARPWWGGGLSAQTVRGREREGGVYIPVPAWCLLVPVYCQNCLITDDKFYGHQMFRECYSQKHQPGLKYIRTSIRLLWTVPGQ